MAKSQVPWGGKEHQWVLERANDERNLEYANTCILWEFEARPYVIHKDTKERRCLQTDLFLNCLGLSDSDLEGYTLRTKCGNRKCMNVMHMALFDSSDTHTSKLLRAQRMRRYRQTPAYQARLESIRAKAKETRVKARSSKPPKVLLTLELVRNILELEAMHGPDEILAKLIVDAKKGRDA